MQKIKINAAQNNSAPLELGKQHHNGKKRNGLTSKVSTHVLTCPRSQRVGANQAVYYGGPFCLFLFCPRLVEDLETDIHRGTMAEVKLYTERLDDFTTKNRFVFPITMAELESKYNFEGPPSISLLINLDGRVSRDLLASMTMEYLSKMIEWGTQGNGLVLNNHQQQKSLTPKDYCQQCN